MLESVLAGAFIPGFESDILDPALDLDVYLRGYERTGKIAALAKDVDLLVQQSPDEAAAELVLEPGLGQAGLPDGPDFLVYLRYVQRRVHEVRAKPTLVFESTEIVKPPRPVRASRFSSKETADEACTQVLRSNESRARAWVGDPQHQGIWRQHYYADVGHVVGQIMFAGSEGRTEPTTAVALVMKFDVESGNPYIYDAWPEIRLDEAVRLRYPDLPHLFGGYFGDIPDRPWPAQRNFQSSTRDPARRRIADQLDELLTLDDEVLSHAVEALGSHVLPEAMRPWVERIRWRMDAFDWTAARTPE